MTFDPFATSSPTRTDNRRARQGPSDPRSFTWLSESKKKIGQRRHNKGSVSQTSINTWTVEGDETLGDAYPDYQITKANKKHSCSCQTHNGGEFRRGLCTHAVAAMIYAYETKDSLPWDHPNQETSATTTPSSPPITETGAPVGSTGSPPSATTTSASGNPGPNVSNADDLIQTLASQSPNLKNPETSVPLSKKKRRIRPPVTDTSTDGIATSGSTSPALSTTAMDAVPVTDVPGTWPSWLSAFRPHQIVAAKEIVEAFKHTNVVYLDGPTGSGKSLIGWMVAQLMGLKSTVLLTQDKALQDQYLRDFQEVGARTIKGRANYLPQHPIDDSGVEVTCDDCDFRGGDCTYCSEPVSCSYRSAKHEAVHSPLGVLNYAYFIREAGSARGQFTGQDLIIADECDVLENVLLSAAEVVFSSSLRRRLNLGQPSRLDDSTGESYISWLQDRVLPALQKDYDHIKTTAKGVERRRYLRQAQSKIDETANLAETMLDDGDLNWVLSGYKKDARSKEKQGPMIFKPVRVGQYGNDLLWRHGRKFLLMSATIVSPDELNDSLGYRKPTEVVTAPMPFDVDRRLINMVPMARLTRKTEAEATPLIIEGALKVLERWPNERAIVHTVSYKLTETIRSAIIEGTQRKVFTYKDSSEKERIITEFEHTPGAVLVGPSIARGADFKGDKARINIICKMPWLSLGDAQVKARRYAKGGDLWYVTKAVREIVQASGRTTRSEDDWGVTYILDASVSSVIKENYHLFPSWWQEALRRVKPSTLLRGGVIPEPKYHLEEQKDIMISSRAQEAQ